MARIRKFTAYRSLERPYTRISKFNKKNFVRGGFPNLKVVKFDLGTKTGVFDSTLFLVSKADVNIPHRMRVNLLNPK